MSKAPWYSNGLCFRCTQCGNCCTGDAGCVWGNEQEIDGIARYLKKSIGEIRLFHTRLVGNRVSLAEYANGDCIFFDQKTQQCTVYPVRPRQCRSWPFWKSNLADSQSWQEVQTVCPGAGSGVLVELDEIECRADLIDI